jgi:UDP:flavonoid glycosyltransferase YjiC (YdhE family)
MKVAFVTFPHSGHFNPMNARARQLQMRGHKAALFSLPIAEAGARAAGLRARGVPQVAIPVSYHQPGVAARIPHHGTGLVGSLEGLTELRV